MTTLINGQISDELPARDRGLLFGDGLFETLGFQDGACPLWDRHMARLRRGAQVLGIALPDPALLRAECQALANQGRKRVIRITLTRGSGGRGYWPDETAAPTRIVQSRDWPASPAAGLKAIISSVRLGLQPILSGLKHCNRLEQILAAQECQAHGADEAVLLDQAGCVAEAISSNLLLRLRGEWIAPTSPSAVAGVGLEWLLETSPLDLRRRAIDVAELDRVDAMLVINSVAGIRPLAELDRRALRIDEDCHRLQHHWNQHLIPPCDDC
jgi:4-amino-4-deoxychorismate lyase